MACVAGLDSISGNGGCTQWDRVPLLRWRRVVVQWTTSIRSVPLTAGSAVAADTGQPEQKRSGKMGY